MSELENILKNTSSEQAEQAMDTVMAVNLDEVQTDKTVSVAICEYEPDPENPAKRVAKWRIAEISAIVPNYVLHYMMELTQKAERTAKKRAQQEIIDDDSWMDDDADKPPVRNPLIAMMELSILKVWRLTESDMTLQRLQEGLSFDKMQKLFYVFFDGAIPKRLKAGIASNTTTDSK